VEDADAGLAIGLALGGEIPVSRRILLRPELAYRSASTQIDGDVSTHVTSLRILLSRVRICEEPCTSRVTIWPWLSCSG
jgi:hypothetical protein